MTSQVENFTAAPSTNLRDVYQTQLKSLSELFSEWKEDDLIAVLIELNGDLDLAISRISEGHVDQWNEVKSKKEAAKVKPVEKAPRPQTKRFEKKTEEPNAQQTTEQPKFDRKKNFHNENRVKSEKKFDNGNRTEKYVRKPRSDGNDHKERKEYEKKHERKYNNRSDEKRNFNQNDKENVDRTNTAAATISWSKVVKTEAVSEKKEEVKVTPVSATTVVTETNIVKQETPNSSVESVSQSKLVSEVKVVEETKVLPKPITRKFRSEEPVIVPGESNIVDMGLRFGSLHLDETIAEPKPVASTSSAILPGPLVSEEREKFSNPRYISSGMQASSSPVIGKNEPTFVYGPGIGVPAFDYGNDMHARAYAMGYFNDQGNFPLDSSYSAGRSEVKSSSTESPSAAATATHPHSFPPINPMHYAYYPPYFMPGQYPSYQTSYGHGLVNKGMYPPQMYPQGSASGQKQMNSGYAPYMNPMFMAQQQQPQPLASTGSSTTPAPGFAAADKQTNQAEYSNYSSGSQHPLYGFHSTHGSANPSKHERISTGSNIASQEYYNNKPGYENYKYPNNSSYFNPMAGNQQQSYGYGANTLTGQSVNSSANSANHQTPANPNYARHQYWNSQH